MLKAPRVHVSEELDLSDPMAGDVEDGDRALQRRALWLEVPGHCMPQPLVERYGGCMVVLKASRWGIRYATGRHKTISMWDYYMTQPLVELYGGCMVVLKVSWCGIRRSAPSRPVPQHHTTRPLAPPYSLRTVLLKVESYNATS